VCGVLVAAAFAVSMPASAPAIAPPERAAQVPPKADGSLTHSAAKATTFKIGTTITGLAIFSYGTSSVLGGGLLTAFNVSKGWLLYTVNDYAWDKYSPADATPASAETFDVSASLRRNTLKFITYKSVDTTIKFASIYLYTGSLVAMFWLGSVSAIANTGVYYANNLIWDWHDWAQSPAPVVATASSALQH
jgi:uncharacterized membrane protein